MYSLCNNQEAIYRTTKSSQPNSAKWVTINEWLTDYGYRSRVKHRSWMERISNRIDKEKINGRKKLDSVKKCTAKENL